MGAGNGKREIIKENSNFELLKNIPDDQYLCTKCENVPEIKNIDLKNYNIEINCKDHGTNIISIKDYFEEENKYHYYNSICDEDKTLQRDNLDYIFMYCFMCHKKFCKKCLNKHDKTHKNYYTKINEKSSKCQNDYRDCTYFCKQCKLQLSSKNCYNDKSHLTTKREPPEKNDIDFLKGKVDELTRKIENLNYLKKLLNTILTTQEKHAFNYFHNINISNVVNSFKKEEEKDEIIQYKNKIKNFENKIIDYLNIKYNLDLKADETKLDLYARDIPPNDLKLFSLIEFQNLESINLSDNKLSDINILNNFDLSKVKSIDLSKNKIQDLSPLKDLSKKATKLERLFLENNNITNANILKKHYFPNLKEVKLSDNKLSQEEISDIYQFINNMEYSDSIFIVYKINKEESLKNKIRIFGETFVNINKFKCKIIINSNENEKLDLTPFYDYKEDEEELFITFIKTGNITDMSHMFSQCTSLVDLPDISKFDMSNVENMSCMFYNCKNLKEIDDISKWNTSNVKSMQKMFCGCSSLSKLLPIKNWNTEKVEDKESMFDGCKTIIIPEINFDKNKK